MRAIDEGDQGTSDPQLWLHLKQGSEELAGKTSVAHDTIDPTWPRTEAICVDSASTDGQVLCVEIRDDWPHQDPELLNTGCIPLPSQLGAQTVELDRGCTVSYTVVTAPLTGRLDAQKCDALMRDPSHIFRRMWHAEPWRFRRDGQPTCFERRRDQKDREQPPHEYFQETKMGTNCNSNWFEGCPGNLGRVNQPPHFTAMAPALLGFDETIDWFCNKEHQYFSTGLYGNDHAGNCANSNNNILALWGDRLQYNICRNLEWQTCAAQGKLPGQGGVGMRFAYAPMDLDLNAYGGAGKELGHCRGWKPDYMPQGCPDGYATDDIFFLEVCLFNQICANGEEVFRLAVGQFFVCDFSPTKFDELARLLLEPPI